MMRALTTSNFRGMTIENVKKILEDERKISASDFERYKGKDVFFYRTIYGYDAKTKMNKAVYFYMNDNGEVVKVINDLV